MSGQNNFNNTTNKLPEVGTDVPIWLQDFLNAVKIRLDNLVIDPATPSRIDINGPVAIKSVTPGAQNGFNKFWLNVYKTGLTANADNSLMTLAGVANSGGGAIILYSLLATDGTDWQSCTGLVMLGHVFKAAAVTKSGTRSEQAVASTGTISTTWTVTDTTNLVQVNPVIGGITPTAIEINYTAISLGQAIVTPL